MICKLILALPRARRWVNQQVDLHWQSAIPVIGFGFARLPDFFSAELLAAVRVAVVDEVPAPPLEQWGIGAFQELGAPTGKSVAGMALRNLVFVRRGRESSESLLFHELVHTIQWNRLGANVFLALYGLLLREHGYENSPLETMAYDTQSKFNQQPHQPFDAEPIIARRTDELVANVARQSMLNRTALAALRLGG
jgi:hypothetical protein